MVQMRLLHAKVVLIFGMDPSSLVFFRVCNLYGGADCDVVLWHCRPQHMTGMQLVRDLCGGQLTGDQVGSQFITFMPGMLQSGTYLADTGTAG